MRRELALSEARFDMLKRQIAAQAESYDALSARINEARAARHDLRHFVAVMKRLSGEELYGELNQFLGEYADASETEPLPVFCENAVASSILGYYALKAAEHGVAFTCACAIPKRLALSDGDLCVLLGNALENALEASSKPVDPKDRYISVEAKISGRQLLIKIENSHDGRIRQKDGRYLSAKGGRAHGLGLQSIRRVADAWGGYLKTEHDGTSFTLMAAFSLPTEAPPDELFRRG